MDGKPSETCRVIFNKLEKIVHLVGFTIEIYYDARLHESKKLSGNMYLRSTTQISQEHKL